MSRLVKIVNNKYVQIEEYKNPNICFNTNEYDNFEDYCTLRETFDPFEIFYENQELKEKLEEYKNPIKYFKYANKNVTEENKQLKKENKKYKEVINKIQYKFNFYKNTDWGLKSCEILKVFEDILKEVE